MQVFFLARELGFDVFEIIREMGGIMRLLGVIALGVALAGCVSKYAVDSVNVPSAKLNPQGGVYVMLPIDGRYGSKTYAGSGLATAQAISAALQSHTNKVRQAAEVEDLDRAKKAAAASGFSYVFEPQILHWEDRATEWSGIPDKITIRYTVHEISTGSVVASTTSRASSKWATFGGDHPQEIQVTTSPIPRLRYSGAC